MSDLPLNLLRHPRRGLSVAWAQWRSWLAAGLVGALAGGLWGGWQHMRLSQLHEQRTQLQARWQVQSREQDAAAAAHARHRLRRQLLARAADWHERRANLRRLHEALNAQADDTGLRAVRWQGEERRIVLQAWLPASGHVPQLMAGLSNTGPQNWRLQSLGDRDSAEGAGAGVDVVLEAAWPVAAADSRSTRP